MSNRNRKVSILGMGRFGKILAGFLGDEYQVSGYDPKGSGYPPNVAGVSLEEAVQASTIFVAVPIRDFKHVINSIAPLVKSGTTVIDVCSVKVYPVTVMLEHLPPDVGIIGTHPLFGPDSLNNPSGLKMMLTPARDIYRVEDHWTKFFESHAIKVTKMTPEQHDRLAAGTQGITHFIGRILKEAGIRESEIDTLGFQTLLRVIDQTCNDSWELFLDLQNFNPYTMNTIDTLEASIDTIRAKIIQRE